MSTAPVNPETEACRVVVVLKDLHGTVDVAAPMKHKQLCYDILKDACNVINRTPIEAFHQPSVVGCRIVIVMNMAGRVDVAAPLPNWDLCLRMLAAARRVIEEYNDLTAIPQKAFSDRILGV